jgi:glycerol-3-phosphate dehydrogenase (NAD(P)+)
MSETPPPFQNVAVLGAGSFGTALALVLAGNQLPVTLWGHTAGAMEQMAAARENTTYLPGIALPEALRLTGTMADVRDADLILMAVPSKAIREVSAQLAKVGIRDSAVLLSCTKGVERGTGLRMSEVMAEHLPRNTVAALSGPSHAEEVAKRMPTAVVVGCQDAGAAKRLQAAFSTPYFRAYTNDDLAGVELGGALKNIFAIAAGASDGLKLGDNAKAALITRALAELIRLGTQLGGKRETFQGLGGIGDLMVTCFSGHSRNRHVGESLGRGEKIDDILKAMPMVAEGVPTTYSAYECARKLGVETPIIDQVRAVLEGTVSARAALGRLLTRDPKAED